MLQENMVNEAVSYASRAHAGQYRKGTRIPYIVHPMEAAAICASFTDDPEVIAAAVLHDVVEDTAGTQEEIEELFGARVAAIVAGDSEDKREGMPPAETWKLRKSENIAHMAASPDVGTRMVCLGDKLSNIRAIQRDFEKLGDGLWARFNQKDPAEHAWYYSRIADVLEKDLGDTDAWREYRSRVTEVFSSYIDG
jgi:myo-inositol-1(or 4)-monophosphatase